MAEKKINGTSYRVDKLPATKALTLQIRIVKALGSAVERLPVLLGKGSDDERNAAGVAAFTDIFMKNPTADLVALVKDIIELAEINREGVGYTDLDMDGDMSDRLADIVPLAVFIMQEQFASFFGDALAGGSLRKVLSKAH